MATVVPTITKDKTHATVSWVNVTSANLAEAVALPGYRLVSIIISGYAGTGAITINAANDEAGANFTGLKDNSNSAISATAAGYFAIAGDVQWIQPAAASGVTGNNIDAHYRAI